MYYVWKNGALLKVYATYAAAVKHARSAGGYVEYKGRILWGTA